MRPIILFFTLIAASALPQTENGSIDGRVVGPVVPRVYAQVQVILYGPSGSQTNRTTIGPDGRYHFENVSPGHYRLLVFTKKQETNGPDQLITLDPGQHLKDFDFRLFDPSTVRGKVTDSKGKGIDHLWVSLVQFISWEGQRYICGPAVPFYAITDSHGNYVIERVQPGNYYVIAENSPDSGPLEKYYRTYFPGTSDEQKAGTIHVDEGMTITSNLVMQTGPVRTVAGSVSVSKTLVKAGFPEHVNVFEFVLTSDSPIRGKPFEPRRMISKTNRLRGDGPEFELRGVPPGKYDVYPYLQNNGHSRNPDAMRIGDYRFVQTARVPIDVTSRDVANLKISVQPGIDLHGRIKPDPNGSVSLQNVYVQLRPRSYPEGLRPISLVSVNSSGEFLLPYLLDGAYSVRLENLPSDAYVSGVHGAKSSSYEEGAFTVSGNSVPPLEIDVSRNGGILEGFVQKPDGLEWADVIVTLIPDESARLNSGLYKVAKPDSSGHFRITGISPASYKLFAWNPVAPFQDLDFVREIEHLGKQVTVGLGVNPGVRITVTNLE